jgi:hypothetical protein
MSNKYHILEININNIKLNKFENNDYVNKRKDTLFLCENGLHKIIDDEYYKFKLIDNNETKYDDFLDKYTLYSSNSYWKKIAVDNIPYKHSTINISYVEIKLNKFSKNTMVFEIFNGKIIDLYFLSDMSKDDHSFKEDISLFIKMIM